MKPVWYNIIIFILLLVIIAILWNCCNKKQTKDWHDYIKIDSAKKESDSQMVVWRQPGVTDAQLNDFLSDVQAQVCDEVTIFRYCADCDTALFLLDGVYEFLQKIQMQGETVSGGKKKPDPPRLGGAATGILFASNASFLSVDSIKNCKTDDENIEFNRPQGGGRINLIAQSNQQQKGAAGQPNQDQQTPPSAAAQRCDVIIPIFQSRPKNVVVAVFDTGVDTASDLGKYMYKSVANNTSCLGSEADNGYNFAGHNGNWKDDNTSEHHGTIVTREIINEVYSKSSQYGVKILPVKVLDSTGNCFLFDMICALKYAQDRGANIINASLGYYSWVEKTNPARTEPDGNVEFIKTYIQKVLTDNNILLVCAAGNQFPQDPQHYPSRNLDEISFYPASLSTSLKNVIAVTTVNDKGSSGLAQGSISPFQNYSRHIVDVGVQSRSNTGYLFENPLAAHTSLNGSSFATPLVTAALCARYDLIEQLKPLPWIKDDMMKSLMNNNVFIKSTTGLDSGIVDGKIYYW